MKKASSIMFSLWVNKTFSMPVTRTQEEFMTEKDKNKIFRINFMNKR